MLELLVAIAILTLVMAGTNKSLVTHVKANHAAKIRGEAAQAAQATSMNRVNGLFERDMAITMVIVANNSSIIYTNAGTDPYTFGYPS